MIILHSAKAFRSHGNDIYLQWIAKCIGQVRIFLKTNIFYLKMSMIYLCFDFHGHFTKNHLAWLTLPFIHEKTQNENWHIYLSKLHVYYVIWDDFQLQQYWIHVSLYRNLAINVQYAVLNYTMTTEQRLSMILFPRDPTFRKFGLWS
jgi:hypothetical protein